MCAAAIAPEGGRSPTGGAMAAARGKLLSLVTAQPGTCRGGFWSGAVFEAPARIAGLDDIAVVRQPVEHGGRHFGVPGQRKTPPSLMGWYLKFGLFPAVTLCLARCSWSWPCVPLEGPSSFWCAFRMGEGGPFPGRSPIWRRNLSGIIMIPLRKVYGSA
jgi:hypothetical protein